ncbi:MAG: SUMF1/EgtB/PvdO family nonheme iron enzyme [Pseudomonadota bacterium]
MSFDVFLSHNSDDKPAVRELLERLRARRPDIAVWFDEEQLQPGLPWQDGLSRGIAASERGAVLLGPAGIGPWESEEVQVLLSDAARQGKAVIPVLLPGGPSPQALPTFLKLRTWVDLRAGLTDTGLDRLLWGITDERPAPLTDAGADDDQRQPGQLRTPAELWPPAAGPRPSCYAQLREYRERGEALDGATRRQLWEQVKGHRPASYEEWQLATIARWGSPEHLEVNAQFTPLSVHVRDLDEAGQPSPRRQLPFNTLPEALRVVFEQHLAPACVVFAAPGGGKSTLLRHFQLQHALAHPTSDRLLVYAQLRAYRPAEVEHPALDWLEAAWAEQTAGAPKLSEFLQVGAVTLLLDGINEIPRADEGQYRARVGHWRQLVERVEKRYPGVRLLFTCRPMDYSARIDQGREGGLPEIEIQAMEPGRVRDFINTRFEPEAAARIWQQLDDRMALQLYSSPYALNLLLSQIDGTDGDHRIPRNRAALFSSLLCERLRRECQEGRARFADQPGLLSDDDRRALERRKTAPEWLPDDAPLFPALAQLAFHLQEAGSTGDRWGELRRRDACQAMQASMQLSADEAALVLAAAGDLGVFEDDALQAKRIRFVHQQMQEYFAAWVLAEAGGLSRAAGAWRSDGLEESTETLLARGGDDPLPGLPTTGWEESALMAVGLAQDPVARLKELMEVNLPLAGLAAAQQGQLPGEIVTQLRQLLIERSQDPAADLRARVAAGEALGELGDPRLLLAAGRHEDGPLVPVFEAIPAGVYVIGGDPGGFADEQPRQQVELAAFELARHPVTNAEYSRFIQDGGYEDDRYWPGQGLTWRNGDMSPEPLRESLRASRRRFAGAISGPESAVQDLLAAFTMSIPNARQWAEWTRLPEQEFERLIAQAHPEQQSRNTEPSYWRSVRYGNPAQPVVGVCSFEAEAYCLWLSARTNARYRLPSEAEWEAAAAVVSHGKRYPWGSGVEVQRANLAETRLGRTTAVGVFGQSDDRLLDLSGNVWEWTCSPWREGEGWASVAAQDQEDASGRRVVRGGSWLNPGRLGRVGARSRSGRAGRGSVVGFRLCRSAPILEP